MIQMFRFVSNEEALTPELDTSITAASAWVHIVPAGSTKPLENAGAVVLESFSDLKKSIAILEQRLNEETKARTEADLVLANHVAQINNLLRKKHILERNIDRIDHANSLLYNCQVCFERHQTMRLVPCGHMAMCLECTNIVMDANGLCPLCRTAVTRAERTYLS